MSSENMSLGMLFGIAIGDALGVPVEFCSRESLKLSPVTGMRGYGTHMQPAGTWSDDSSLSFCLAEALCEPFDLHLLASKFDRWLTHGYWTPHGKVFDVGNATWRAIVRIRKGQNPVLCGGFDESDNGNGSLMRILPIIFFCNHKQIYERYELVKSVSSLTHAHIRSVIACFYYVEFALRLLSSKDKFLAYSETNESVLAFLRHIQINPNEIAKLDRLINSDVSICNLLESEIHSSGYVIHTLEAAVWCLLNNRNYRDTVLNAVNLGGDSDTTGAVAGGLAGLLYGYNDMPEEWINQITRKEDIMALGRKLGLFYNANNFYIP